MKKILYIGISYYTYTERIIKTLEYKGYVVTYYPLENRSFWMKTFKKFLPSLYKRRLIQYHEDFIIKESGTHYDYVFFIQVHHFSMANIKQLKESQPQASFILYNWDSLATHDYRPYIEFFNAIYTFDKEDAAKLSVNYLSLFSLPEYFEVKSVNKPFYDLYFVGAIGTLSRFKAILELDNFCKAENLRVKKHLQCSPVIMLKLLFKGLFTEGITLKSISASDIIKIMENAVAVFDFPNHIQSGYTMRLIENMCAGKKIVTANTNITYENFYSDDRFLLVKNLDFSDLKTFLQKPITTQTSFNHFSLSHWLDKMFKAQ